MDRPDDDDDVMNTMTCGFRDPKVAHWIIAATTAAMRQLVSRWDNPKWETTGERRHVCAA